MRIHGLALAGLLAWTVLAAAQKPGTQPPQTQPPQTPEIKVQPPVQPQPPVVLDPRNRVDELLMRWEKEMKAVQSLSAQCQRIEENKTFKVTDVFLGTAKYMKAVEGAKVTNLAMLQMSKKDKQDVWEKFVCNGTHLYQYSPSTKEVRIHALPPQRANQVADDNFLSFLFGMRAEEAKRRYDLRLVKEDQWYVYIEILPRFDQDRADFQKARLVLNKDNFLPRQLWFEQPNGDTVTWDIPKIENNVPLNRKEFETPEIPQGWKKTEVARNSDVPPRVVRPNGQ